MSRIHDALKKAEAERARAAAADMPHLQAGIEAPEAPSSESPNSSSTPVAGPLAEPRAPGLGTDLPMFAGVAWPLNQGRVAGPKDGRVDIPALHGPNKSVACEAALLEQCARFDWATTPRKMISTNRGQYRIGAEEFRTLRSSLDLTRKQQPLKTLLVTSPLPKEGKTFVAVNLSRALALRRDHRVLLIDGDLRLSRVHNCFDKMPQEPGLADFLTGGADPISLIHRGPEDNFFVLPAGRSVSNPLEFIGNGRLRPLIQWLAPAFDWIVIDSPPSVPVSDARLIAECADGVLFVVRAGQTPFDLAQRSLGQIRGKRYLGVVLNAVDAASTASSYYYGGDGDRVNRKQPS
jgi:protein-tyrosine kinase